jgi:hypothetical protein
MANIIETTTESTAIPPEVKVCNKSLGFIYLRFLDG